MINLVRGLRKFQIKGKPFKTNKIVEASNLISLSLPVVPENWILPNLTSFELLLRSNSNIRFDNLALLEFLEELSIECTNFSKPIFSLTGINRLRHLKILRIIDSCPVNSKKDRWRTDKKKYTGESLKRVLWSAQSPGVLRWVVDLFEGSSVDVRFEPLRKAFKDER